MAVCPDQGEQWYVDKAQNVAPLSNALMDYQTFGTGSTAEGETVTIAASVTEVSEARVQGTLSQPSADTDRLVASTTFGGSKTVTQYARTNTASKGDGGERLLLYALFTGIPVQSGDSIEGTGDIVAGGS